MWNEVKSWPWEQLTYEGSVPPSCWVAIEEDEEDPLLVRLVVYVDCRETHSVELALDQWGHWLIFGEDLPLVVAQEDGAKAFLPAYIEALSELQRRIS